MLYSLISLKKEDGPPKRRKFTKSLEHCLLLSSPVVAASGTARTLPVFLAVTAEDRGGVEVPPSSSLLSRTVGKSLIKRERKPSDAAAAKKEVEEEMS